MQNNGGGRENLEDGAGVNERASKQAAQLAGDRFHRDRHPASQLRFNATDACEKLISSDGSTVGGFARAPVMHFVCHWQIL